MEPFLVRALAAGLGLAVIAAPLGCFLVWQRMAFFGETVAHASLIGIALALAFDLDMTASALAVAGLVAIVLFALSRQRILPVDSLLSLLSHASLAVGVLAAALVKGSSIDLMAYLFGDIFAVTTTDLAWLAAGGIAVLIALRLLWKPLLALAVHEELAVAEGVNRDRVKIAFVLLLAVLVAMAMKLVGVLLTVAFLVIPAAAARPLSRTPERMVMLAAGAAAVGVVAGLGLSWGLDAPGGPSIVVALAVLALASLSIAALRNH
ncbi:MAG: metal ABC transporter permease [Hyphomicrobiaceae bacterium]